MLFKLLIQHTVYFLPFARAATVPLLITNRCRETIWPGLYTANGTGPKDLGFELASRSTRNLSVFSDWNGRVWGRTNCSFDGAGMGRCGSGDCGGRLGCGGIVSFLFFVVLVLWEGRCADGFRVRLLHLRSLICRRTRINRFMIYRLLMAITSP